MYSYNRQKEKDRKRESYVLRPRPLLKASSLLKETFPLSRLSYTLSEIIHACVNPFRRTSAYILLCRQSPELSWSKLTRFLFSSVGVHGLASSLQRAWLSTAPVQRMFVGMISTLRSRRRRRRSAKAVISIGRPNINSRGAAPTGVKRAQVSRRCTHRRARRPCRVSETRHEGHVCWLPWSGIQIAKLQ